eukprot:5251677-Ditylum_brightwellii.AAC.1
MQTQLQSQQQPMYEGHQCQPFYQQNPPQDHIITNCILAMDHLIGEETIVHTNSISISKTISRASKAFTVGHMDCVATMDKTAKQRWMSIKTMSPCTIRCSEVQRMQLLMVRDCRR